MKVDVEKYICNNFPITETEYAELDKKFSKLCYYAAHQLQKKNCKNNYTEDFDDINQKLQLDLIKAGSYYKRQIYLEKCLNLVLEYSKDNFLNLIAQELNNLWKNRTKHGASRQKFGEFQEKLLEKLMKKVVPAKLIPNKKDNLCINGKFATYCKAIIWNGQKSIGRVISKNKAIRNGMVSIGEFSNLF